jgi:uracil-DNA glycosylase family 4
VSLRGDDIGGADAHVDTLEALRALMGECARCGLAEGRTTLVFGVGDPHARLMFIGEAPGKNEDLKGEPFVGAAGKLLDQLLAGIGLSRHEVYIANILKSRPPGNRDPLPDEIDACTPFLREQIRLIDPDVIATLGNYSTRFMLGTSEGITTLRGRLFRRDGRLIVPIFHPAVGLYDPKKRPELDEDFKRLAVVLGRVARGEIDPRAEAGPSSAEGPDDGAVQHAERSLDHRGA